MGRMKEDISGRWSDMKRNADAHTMKDINGLVVWLESRMQLNEQEEIKLKMQFFGASRGTPKNFDLIKQAMAAH